MEEGFDGEKIRANSSSSSNAKGQLVFELELVVENCFLSGDTFLIPRACQNKENLYFGGLWKASILTLPPGVSGS
jgi:hypothetical protein